LLLFAPALQAAGQPADGQGAVRDERYVSHRNVNVNRYQHVDVEVHHTFNMNLYR
jgi:hypothetical protein